MGLGVPEIRARAERLKTEVARERYAARAGLKERPAFAEVYASQDVLLGSEAVPAIQRELAETTGEGQRRLRYLLAWVAEQQAEAAVAPLEDEIRAWEAAAAVRLGTRELPYRGVPRALEEEPNRGTRVALERARNQRLDEILPLRLDLFQRSRTAVEALGFGGYVEARERLSGIDVRGLRRQAARILEETEDGYREQLACQCRGRLELASEQAVPSDLAWLRRMAWLNGRLGLAPILEAVRRDLDALGLPLEAGGRVKLDLKPRPLREAGCFSVPIRVPDEVILGVSPTGGWPDCRGLLHEVGHTLHFAYTDPNLPFEYRALGDSAVTEAFALLLELLCLEACWVRRAAGLEGRELEEYRMLAGFLQLCELRRQAGRLLYEVELRESERPGEMGARYAEILAAATGFRHEERTYLEGVDRGFWVARQLRAWMLWAVLRPVVRDRYDEDWYRNPAAGPFLGELFSGGQRENASRMAAELGAERLSAGCLIESVREWLP